MVAGETIAVIVSAGELVIVTQGGIELARVTGEAAEHIRRCMARGYRFEGTALPVNGQIKVVVHGVRASEV
jgi:hypothetical protein